MVSGLQGLFLSSLVTRRLHEKSMSKTTVFTERDVFSSQPLPPEWPTIRFILPFFKGGNGLKTGCSTIWMFILARGGWPSIRPLAITGPLSIIRRGVYQFFDLQKQWQTPPSFDRGKSATPVPKMVENRSVPLFGRSFREGPILFVFWQLQDPCPSSDGGLPTPIPLLKESAADFALFQKRKICRSGSGWCLGDQIHGVRSESSKAGFCKGFPLGQGHLLPKGCLIWHFRRPKNPTGFRGDLRKPRKNLSRAKIVRKVFESGMFRRWFGVFEDPNLFLSRWAPA